MNPKPPLILMLFSALLCVACIGTDPPPADTTPPLPDVVEGQDSLMHQATGYIESRSQAWIDTRKCSLSCHTTLPFLMTNPFATAASRTLADDIRARVEGRVTAWPDVDHFYPSQPVATEAVLNAVALLYYDMNLSQELSPLACTAVEVAWAVQDEDGGFGWWSFNLEPFELASSNFWAGAMFSLAIAETHAQFTDVGMDCDALRTDRSELAGLHGWLIAGITDTDAHGRAWLLWADQTWAGDLLVDSERADIFTELKGKQREDGGFGLRDFLSGDEADQSDGYMSSLIGLLLQGSQESTHQDALASLSAWMAENHTMDRLQMAASPNKPGVARNDAFFTDTAVSFWMRYNATYGVSP